MILSEIKSYICKHKKASVSELSSVFSVEPSALEDMIDRLVVKGYVYRKKSNYNINQCLSGEQSFTGCSIKGKCGSCPFSYNKNLERDNKNEIIEWATH